MFRASGQSKNKEAINCALLIVERNSTNDLCSCNTIGLLFEVGSFVQRLNIWLKRVNINLEFSHRMSSIYFQNKQSTLCPHLDISLEMATQSDGKFSHKNCQLIIQAVIYLGD